MQRFRTGLLLLGMVAMVGAWTCKTSDQATPAKPAMNDGEMARRDQVAAVIQLTNMLTFEPKVDTIAAGQTVEWNNGSLLVHTVTADPSKATKDGSTTLPDGAEAFDSGNIEPDGKFTHQFTVPGLYRYFCIPHEGALMIGEIVVLPAKEGGK